jgi:tetratricopeptide (TPR) repeat protein
MSIRKPQISRRTIAAALATIGVVPLLWLAGPWGLAAICRSRGTAALRSGNEELALGWFGRAEKFQGDSGLTQFLLARTCRRMNRIDEMQQHLERALACGFPKARVEREQWLCLAQNGQTNRLGSRLQALLDDPGDDGREILAALTGGYVVSFDLDSANFVLGEWMARYPDDPESYARAAKLRQVQGEWPAAVELYRRSLKIAAGRTVVRLSLAQCLALMNDPALAEPEFRRCLAEQPDNVEAGAGLGACLVNLSRVDEARTVLTETLRRDPHHFEVARSLAELELSQGNCDAALAMLTPLAKSWPHDKQLCTLMARALQESGQVDSAQPFWDEAERATAALEQVDGLMDKIKRDGNDLAARYELGTLLLERRSREEGAGWLQSILMYEPDHRAAHAALADYFERAGEPKLARMHRDLEARLAESGDEP